MERELGKSAERRRGRSNGFDLLVASLDVFGYDIYIYPCIEFGRLGCACIIFKCSMNAIILAQVNLNQNSIHCCFFLGQ